MNRLRCVKESKNILYIKIYSLQKLSNSLAKEKENPEKNAGEDICWRGVPGCRHLIVVTLKEQKLEGEGKRINECTFATVNKRA